MSRLQGTSSSPDSHSFSVPKITLNTNRTYALDDLIDDDAPVSGQGAHWHEFSTIRFDSKAQARKYREATGLDTKTNVRQDWGQGTSGRLYRSRRGSISGSVTDPKDGSVSMFRFSSFATSKALRQGGDSDDFVDSYTQAMQKMATRAKKSNNSNDSINAVASDIGKVAFADGEFQLTRATHASGFSGKGLGKMSKSDKESVFHHSIETAEALGNTPTPAQTYHSEPMALALHEQERGSRLRDEPDLIAMVTSIPNQVCRNCGNTFIKAMGENSFVSGMPGLPFGGQKPGIESNPQLGRGTTSKTPPASELRTMARNLREIEQIHAYHGSNGQPSTRSSSSSSSTSSSSASSSSSSSSSSRGRNG
ncbi:MAG: hypothetical protein H6926_09065 [Chromatiales bacterium]|nr:hypothetical protein [Gammaproteobacteria bacterium]MCP5353318.1 hypothetical protein [Chromatiales bacterium]